MTRGSCLEAGWSVGWWWAAVLHLHYSFFCDLFHSRFFLFLFNLSSFSLYDCYYCCHIINSSNIIIVKFLLSQPTSLFTFTLPILLPLVLMGGKWVSTCMMFSCWLGLNHNSTFGGHLVQSLSSSRAIPRSAPIPNFSPIWVSPMIYLVFACMLLLSQYVFYKTALLSFFYQAEDRSLLIMLSLSG